MRLQVVAVEGVLRALREGTPVMVRAGGASMRPAIEDGDVVRIDPMPAEGPALWDVVVIATEDGGLVAHRVVALEAGGVVTEGDAAGRREGPWPRDRVVGVVVSSYRDGDWRHLLSRVSGAPRDLATALACVALGVAAGGGSWLAPLAAGVTLGTAWAAWKRARRRDLALLAAVVAADAPAWVGAGEVPWVWALLGLALLELDREGRRVAAAAVVLLALSPTWWLAGVGARALLGVCLAEAVARHGRRHRRRVSMRWVAALGIVAGACDLLWRRPG